MIMLLFKLMFENGMRLGECLGLTEADLVKFGICDEDVRILLSDITGKETQK